MQPFQDNRPGPEGPDEIETARVGLEKNPGDARAMLRLGNLLYARGRRDEAISWWEKAARQERDLADAWRNLGIAYYNVYRDVNAAKGALQRAFKISLAAGAGSAEEGHGGDARILHDRDQVWRLAQETPAARAAELEKYPHLVRQLDELAIAYCALLNQLQRHDEALTILQFRAFGRWEDREGLILEQWVRTHVALGRESLWRAPGAGGDPRKALAYFNAGLKPPPNLGPDGSSRGSGSELHYWAGMAARACREEALAGHHFGAAAQEGGGTVCEEGRYWAGAALRELGREADARKIFEGMVARAESAKAEALKAVMLQAEAGKTGAPAEADAARDDAPRLEEDAPATRARRATLLEALGRHGLNGAGDRQAARRLLQDLLVANPGDATAADLLVALEWGMV